MKVAVALVLVLAACGGKSSPPPQEPVKEAEPEPEADGYGYEGEPVESDEPPYKETEPYDPGPPPVLVTIDPAELAAIGTGETACDELIWRTKCMWDKAGSAISDDMKKMFEDGIAAWKMALQNDATKQATADACKMSLDAAGHGFGAMGC